MIGTQIGKSTKVNDVSNQFHLYQLYWSNNKIEVYVDNKLFYTYTKPANANYDSWPFDNEFNIILNTAVGGNWGGVKGIDDSIFPQKYIIDYVKIYGTR
jgi:beta-glucanase (GH16 family)